MAAAAAEETADVNAPAFIGPRRFGASRDGACARPSAPCLASRGPRRGPVGACAERCGWGFNPSSALRWLRRARRVFSLACEPSAKIPPRGFFKAKML